MLRVLPILIVVGLALYTFFDVLTTDKRQLRSLGKGAWLIVALIPAVGAMLWFLVGRPASRRSGKGPGRRPPRPVAPDDDPAFLRRLDEQAWRAKRAHRAQPPPPPIDPADPASQQAGPGPVDDPGSAGAAASPDPGQEPGPGTTPPPASGGSAEPPASEDGPKEPRSWAGPTA
jgi:hypothetical protein